jgi:hypothetical protein
MNKIATYLNEHLTGEVITEGAELEAVSVDGGVLLERHEETRLTYNPGSL